MIKLLLIIYGYDRNMKVETYRGENNRIGYDYSAENKDGKEYFDENCEGLVFNVCKIIEELGEGCASPLIANPIIYLCDMSVHDLLDDEIREKVINSNNF